MFFSVVSLFLYLNFYLYLYLLPLLYILTVIIPLIFPYPAPDFPIFIHIFKHTTYSPALFLLIDPVVNL